MIYKPYTEQGVIHIHLGKQGKMSFMSRVQDFILQYPFKFGIVTSILLLSVTKSFKIATAPPVRINVQYVIDMGKLSELAQQDDPVQLEAFFTGLKLVSHRVFPILGLQASGYKTIIRDVEKHYQNNHVKSPVEITVTTSDT